MSADVDKELEREKLRAELDGLKLGNRKLVADLKSERIGKWLGFAAGAVSTVIAIAGNWTSIKALFYGNPATRLAVSTTDPFLRETAIVRIDGSATTPKLSEVGALELAPGQHQVRVIVGDTTISTTDVVLRAGETSKLVLGDELLRKVHVVVTEHPVEVHAGESMELTVTASGVGFTWVFRSEPDGRCTLAFPFHSDGSAISDTENLVGPDRPLTFPRPSEFGAIMAPTRPGPGKLYVIVTSVNDSAQASGIAAFNCKTGVTKAPARNLVQNWGMQVVPFTVL